MKTLFTELSNQLHLLSEALGVHCCWKNGPMLFPEKRLPESTTKHRCAFCDAVKRHPGAESRCRRNDALILTDQLIHSDGRSFSNRCPAGVWDLVVPFKDGEEYLGAVLAGPFRMPEDSAEMEPELFAGLPVFTRSRTQRIAALITAFLSPSIQDLYQNQFPSDARFAAARDYLRKHFGEKPSAETVAQKIGLSRSRFLHSFAAQCGRSFHQELNMIRLEYARGRIWHSDDSLDFIAAECGFSNQSHFSAAFKLAYGITPRQWRRQRQKTD